MQVTLQGPYDQFLLFGDSLIQFSCSQVNGFAFSPALQDGMTGLFGLIENGHSYEIPVTTRVIYHISDYQSRKLAFIRRLDVINRGFSVWHLLLCMTAE